MRLVIDLIRGKDVHEAYAILQVQQEARGASRSRRRCKSAVANAEQAAQQGQRAVRRRLCCGSSCAIVNEGPPLKRFTAAAQGRATPIRKRTSHVEIHVAAKESE